MNTDKHTIQVAIRDRKEVVQLEDVFKGVCEQKLCDVVKRGEYYVFQVLLKAIDEGLEGITLEKGEMICFNQEKVDHQGRKNHQPIDLNANEMKVLWLGVHIPVDQTIGIWHKTLKVIAEECVVGKVELELNVQKEVSEDQGIKQLDNLARLFWLQSTKGIDTQVTKEYLPICYQEGEVRLTGKGIELNKQGLPDQITSYYDEQIQLVEKGSPLFKTPLRFSITLENGEILNFDQPFTITSIKEDAIVWENSLEDDRVSVQLKGEIQYDGWMGYSLSLQAKQELKIRETCFEVMYHKVMSGYMMGLGKKGGLLTEDYTWQWDRNKHQDQVWIGSVNGGVRWKFSDQRYTKPLCNVYFNQRYLEVPKGWDNEGKGRIHVQVGDEQVKLYAVTGSYTLRTGEIRDFKVEGLMTPVKPIDYTKHWQTRYYHPNENTKVGNEWINNVKDEGCNYTIIHHGQKVHPFINYPFIEEAALNTFIEQAHAEDIGVKLYYTMREMTNHAAEFWPWYHLGLFLKASETEPVFWEGRKKLWAQEVFGRKVIPAWEHEFGEGKYKGDICSAVIVEPNGPLDNYYIEGLDYLVKELDIDGIYIDDTCIGRETLRRARKVLDQKEGCLVDVHSWNHMNKHAGFASSMLIYMDLIPYIDSLWYGEGFDYNASPDYWLIEMVGIPYGVMGQMLQGGGHPYRGMLYGMTNRTGWGHKSAKAFYDLWDQFGIQESKMYGYWSTKCPVSTSCETILATAYIKEKQALIVLASWSDQDEQVEIQIGWEKIGWNPGATKITLPAIDGLQVYEEVSQLANVKVKANVGCFIIVEKLTI